MKYLLSITLILLSYITVSQEVNRLLVSSHHHIAFAPGIKLGMEHEIGFGAYQKHKKNKIKTKYKELFIQPSISFNNQKHVYKSVHPSIDFGYRRIKPKGYKFEILWGTGALFTIREGTTYKVNDGEIDKSWFLSGRSYITQNIGFGVGQDLTRRCLPLSWHLRLYNSFLYPYNTFQIPQLSIEAGVTIMLHHKKMLY